MAESDNILTKLQDLLVYLVPQLNKFQGDECAGVIGAGSRRPRERPDAGA